MTTFSSVEPEQDGFDLMSKEEGQGIPDLGVAEAGGNTREGRMEVANPGLFGLHGGLLGTAVETAAEVEGSQTLDSGES